MPVGMLSPDLAGAVAVGGEAGRTFAEFDWGAHPLGPPREWPEAVRSMVAVALASRFPVVLWLGEDLTMVYNDGYIPMLGDKHPWAMGMPGLEVWREVRDIIAPMLRSVVETGVATWSDDLLLPLVDQGRPWEKYFTFTYSPIFLPEGGVGGVFCAVAETTERVIGERRLRALNSLGTALVDAQTVGETVTATVTACNEQPADLPFVALYTGGAGGQVLRAATPDVADLLAAAAPRADFWEPSGGDGTGGDGTGTVIEDLVSRLPGLAAGWSEGAPERALVLRLDEPGSFTPVGTVVIGLSPRRPLDEQYRGFCRLLADQVAAGLANAGAHEAERARAEALAELDRAKTLFLTDVSHELRTPLTLMLGPLDDALALAADDWVLREQLLVVQRAGRRLLRLVNSLLDFARIEAGRVDINLVETDVGSLTANIASSFSDVCRRAGLDLVVDCSETVGQVDPEMWETIVLNLLSNAFKFTLTGSITVAVAPGPDHSVMLSVTDTGVGIPEQELPRIFERFYRPPQGEGRSVEGSGVGLALVSSLVDLHGGTVSVSSRPGAGTTFTVTVPYHAGVPELALVAREQPGHDSNYVTEAVQWLESQSLRSGHPVEGAPATTAGEPLILIVDDNADLRVHLEQILSTRWSTVSAVDGEQALELVRQLEPDLVIADVMMPKLDGFELMKAMRADPRLETIPVMILSARAGAEAAGEGFRAGADDYLVKPFQSSELVERVAARLEVAARERARRERERLEVARASGLIELGSLLAAATDEAGIVRGLLGPALSSLAIDAVGVGVLEEGSRLLRMTYGGAFKPELAHRYHAMSIDAPVPQATVVRTGRPMVVTDTLTLDDEFGAVVSDSTPSVRAAVIQPLRLPGDVIVGGMSLMWAEPRQFTEAEVALIDEVGVLVARAIERMQRADREHKVAVALQDRLLEWGGHSAAAAISTVYRPASDSMRVGGDWYTITALGESGRIGLSVGDVVGHGLPAATVMSELRSALAASALAVQEPSRVLDLLESYARQVPGAACTTAVYVMVDPPSGTFGYACAGHPYPLLVSESGEARLLEDGRRPALSAGSSRGAGRSEGLGRLDPGSMLILYTDGLVERRGESLEQGFERLMDAGRGLAHASVGDACAGLLSALAGPAGYEDDVVVVALRPTGSTARSLVEAFPADVSRLPAVRSKLGRWLNERGVAVDCAYDVLTCVGEAAVNAVVHGSKLDPAMTVILEVFLVEDHLTATVTDSGHWDVDSAAEAGNPVRKAATVVGLPFVDPAEQAGAGLPHRGSPA